MKLHAAALFLLMSGLPCQTLILHNAKIWTGNAKQPEASAIVLDREHIAFVGEDAEALSRAGKARVINLNGRRVLPGLIDAHVHFIGGGDELLAPDLRTAQTEQEFARRLGDAAKRVDPGTWLTSGTWDHENWPGAKLPTRQVLDQFTPDHPVFVDRLDGHMAVANSKAIQLAGITAKTPDPPGGTIVRDSQGEATGVFKDTAMTLVSRRVPGWTERQRMTRVRAAMAHAAALGVTGVHDMNAGYADFATFQTLDRLGALTVRITEHTPIQSHERWGAVRVQRGFGSDMLMLNGLKGYADGSLGSTTAWFFEPDFDSPSTSGLSMPELLAGGAMEDHVRACTGLGLQVAIHAIGDRANAAILDIFDRVGSDAELSSKLRALRPRIEHSQHLRPLDIPRFGKLGVVPSVQPYHIIDDGRWAEKRIGALRCQSTYPFRDLLQTGAALAFGSDWPVAPLSPMLGIYAAVTRRTLDDKNPEGWIPEQKISVAQAVRAYTMGSAYAGHRDQELGSLEPGKLADLVVLDRDIFTIPAETIRDARVDITVVHGRIVHQRASDQAQALQPKITGRDEWGAEWVDQRVMTDLLPSRLILHAPAWAKGSTEPRAMQAACRASGEPDLAAHWLIDAEGRVHEGRDVHRTVVGKEDALVIALTSSSGADHQAALVQLCAWCCARWSIPVRDLSWQGSDPAELESLRKKVTVRLSE